MLEHLHRSINRTICYGERETAFRKAGYRAAILMYTITLP